MLKYKRRGKKETKIRKSEKDGLSISRDGRIIDEGKYRMRKVEECFPAEMLDVIQQVLKKGNAVELKRENNHIVVVEIQRKAKMKTSATGQRETADRG